MHAFYIWTDAVLISMIVCFEQISPNLTLRRLIHRSRQISAESHEIYDEHEAIANDLEKGRREKSHHHSSGPNPWTDHAEFGAVERAEHIETDVER